jgi:STIP1 family protein 1
MAGADTRYDPSKALAFKEQGNKCFQAGDFAGAEGLYTKGYAKLPKRCSNNAR